MKRNMGTADRGIRLTLAVVVAILYITGKISGVAAIVLGIFALAFFVTSLVGHCPAYPPLGLTTIKEKKNHPDKPR
jgi:Na+(H+)/acetate symporter ActP